MFMKVNLVLGTHNIIIGRDLIEAVGMDLLFSDNLME